MYNEKSPTGQGQAGQAVTEQNKDSNFLQQKQISPALAELQKKIEAEKAITQAAPISENMTESAVIQETETERFLQILRDAYIDPLIQIDKPPTCLWLQTSSISTLGNFSMIIGKAKSRKTFLITAALAAAATENNPVLNYRGELPDGKKQVLYFDTEQGKYHAQRTVKRVCELAKINFPLNFKAYGLRKYSPEERLKAIETALYNTEGLGFVVIDGVRDLVTSINDEPQATMLSTFLLKWTEELNIHIIVVLHQNKTDANARGHIGTELQNKAETVLSVKKWDKNREISIVEAEYCRDKEPETFAFYIENGLPVLTPDWEVKSSLADRSKKTTPDEIPAIDHIRVLKEVFKLEPKPLANVLYSNIVLQFKRLFNVKIGQNKATEFATYYKAEGWLSVNETTKTKDRFHILNENEILAHETQPF